MSGTERPADGPSHDGLWFTPEERQKILQRAYPSRWTVRGTLAAYAGGIWTLVRTGLVLALSPVLLALHGALKALGRNGIVHTKPAGHGIVVLCNVHAFKRTGRPAAGK